MSRALLPADKRCDALRALVSKDDVCKVALYGSKILPESLLNGYTTEGEASGQGYVAGGQTLEGFVCGKDPSGSWFSWSKNPIWPVSTIKGIRYALIYNTSKGNQAVSVTDFNEEKSSRNGPFTVYLPHKVITLR